MCLNKRLLATWGFSVTVALFSAQLLAENTPPQNWPQRSPIVFWGDRASEDWRYVDNLTEQQKHATERLKRIPLDEGANWKISLSGNVKFSLDNRRNYNYQQDLSKKNELRSRYHFASELNWRDKARLYTSVRTNYTTVSHPGPIDNAGTDIHQLFAEFYLFDHAGQSLTTRLGRQEIYLNDWQIMNREPTPVKSSWNAAMLKYTRDDVNIQGWYAEEVFPRYHNGSWSGNWDDRANGNRSAGILAGWQSGGAVMQAYYMHNKLKNNSFVHAPAGNLHIQLLGLHAHHAVTEGVGYMADTVYQFGDHAGKPISAYMGYVDVNYNWIKNWHYRSGINVHYASGSGKNSRKVNTFNPLWTGDPLGFATDGAYANAIQGGLYTVIEYLPQQSLTGGLLSTWRANTEDAIYSLNQDQLFSANSAKKYAYTQFYLQFHNYWTGNLKTEINLYYAPASRYLNDVLAGGAKAISRVELAMIYNF